MSGIARDDVIDAIYRCDAWVYSGDRPATLAGQIADAVMALLADTAPEVLWEGETVEFQLGPNQPAVVGRSEVRVPRGRSVPVPPGTRVAVVAPVVAGEPESTPAPDDEEAHGA